MITVTWPLTEDGCEPHEDVFHVEDDPHVWSDLTITNGEEFQVYDRDLDAGATDPCRKEQ